MGEDVTRPPRHGRHAGWYPKLDVDPKESGLGFPENPEITNSMSTIILADTLEAVTLERPNHIMNRQGTFSMLKQPISINKSPRHDKSNNFFEI